MGNKSWGLIDFLTNKENKFTPLGFGLYDKRTRITLNNLHGIYRKDTHN